MLLFLGQPQRALLAQSTYCQKFIESLVTNVILFTFVLADEKSNLCREAVDIGFVIDSSKSIKKFYSKEKFFVQRVASAAGFNKGSRAGVVLFSSGSYVKMLVSFTNNIAQFRNDVEKLPLYGYQTRIDKALKVAGEDLFAEKNGDRPNVKDILVLVTDGKQTPPAGGYDGVNEIVVEPEDEARRLRSRNITIYAIGVGGAVNKTQLELITGSPDQVYMLKRFDELVADEFIKNLTEFACKGGELSTFVPLFQKSHPEICCLPSMGIRVLCPITLHHV